MATSKIRSLLSYLFLGLGLAALLAPIWQLIREAQEADPQIWSHLQNYQLYPSVQYTALFVVGSTVVAGLLGTGWALIARFSQLPSFLFHGPMLLLLSLPTYVLGFIYLSFLDFSGPVQGFFKILFTPELFFEPRQMSWAVFVFGVSMAPYIYFSVSVGLQSQIDSLIEASLSLGAGLRKTLMTVVLPLLTPWLSGAAALVALEALADFGFVDLYGINTLSRLLYKSWGSLFSLGAAARLGLLLLSCCFALLLIARWLQKKESSLAAGTNTRIKKPFVLKEEKMMALLWFIGFLIFTFIPVWTLSSQALSAELWSTLPWARALLSSLGLALASGLGLVFFSALLFFISRKGKKFEHWVFSFLGTGYGIPGTLLAIAFYIFVSRALNIQLTSSDYFSLLALITVLYFCKFNALVINGLRSQRAQLGDELFEAAETLAPRWRNWLLIKLPLYLPSLLLGIILVFVEILKELPAAMMLKPFATPNLALRIHQYASESDWPRASVFSLVLLSLTVSLLLLQKMLTDHRNKLK